MALVRRPRSQGRTTAGRTENARAPTAEDGRRFRTESGPIVARTEAGARIAAHGRDRAASGQSRPPIPGGTAEGGIGPRLARAPHAGCPGGPAAPCDCRTAPRRHAEAGSGDDSLGAVPAADAGDRPEPRRDSGPFAHRRKASRTSPLVDRDAARGAGPNGPALEAEGGRAHGPSGGSCCRRGRAIGTGRSEPAGDQGSGRVDRQILAGSSRSQSATGRRRRVLPAAAAGRHAANGGRGAPRRWPIPVVDAARGRSVRRGFAAARRAGRIDPVGRGKAGGPVGPKRAAAFGIHRDCRDPGTPRRGRASVPPGGVGTARIQRTRDGRRCRSGARAGHRSWNRFRGGRTCPGRRCRRRPTALPIAGGIRGHDRPEPRIPAGCGRWWGPCRPQCGGPRGSIESRRRSANLRRGGDEPQRPARHSRQGLTHRRGCRRSSARPPRDRWPRGGRVTA